MNPVFEFDKKKSSVLIVDDHAYIVKILEEILKKEGYKCFLAYDAQKAYQILSDNIADLILLDIMMPDEDGFEFCKKLKNNTATAEIPVIFITAKIEIEDKINGFNLGAVDYITKPFNAVEVIARVATHIQLKKSKDFIKNYNLQLEQIIDVRTKELIKSEKQAAFGQLIQGIIHNIRGPVAGAISSFSLIEFYRDDIKEYLKDKPGLPDEVNDKLKEIWEIIEHDDKMLNNLLKTIDSMMVKSRSDKSEVAEVIDLNDIIRQEIEFMNADKMFNKIDKNISLIDKPLKIKAIPGDISQVFNNIIRNSLDAMYNRKNSRISVSTGNTGSFVWFSITDNGPGIPADIINKIFDPFFTTKIMKSEVNSTVPTGTGIGLHFCKQTVESYGGEIEVQSSEAGGTTFTVSLPTG